MAEPSEEQKEKVKEEISKDKPKDDVSKDTGKPPAAEEVVTRVQTAPEAAIDTSKKKKIKINIGGALAQGLENKKLELLEIEARITKKMDDFKELVNSIEIEGKALAGQAVEKTSEQKDEEAANKMIEGTGLTLGKEEDKKKEPEFTKG